MPIDGGQWASFLAELRPEFNPPQLGMFSSAVSLREGLELSLRIPVSGAMPLTTRWFHDGTEVTNPPNLTNATHRLEWTAANPYSGQPAQVQLRVYSARSADAGEYTFEVSNPCGATRGGPITVTLTCGADFNGDGEVNPVDITDFLQDWFAWRSSANVDGRYGCYVGDIFAFLTFYFEGCG